MQEEDDYACAGNVLKCFKRTLTGQVLPWRSQLYGRRRPWTIAYPCYESSSDNSVAGIRVRLNTSYQSTDDIDKVEASDLNIYYLALVDGWLLCGGACAFPGARSHYALAVVRMQV